MVSGKNVFITGGAGFIGANIAGKLVGENRVTVYDSLKRDALKYSPFRRHENLRLIKGDVLDKENLERAIESTNPDYVIHLAAVAGVESVVERPTKTIQVNFLGTHNILEAIKDGKVRRFVDFSTSEVYGPQAFNVGESDSTPIGQVGEARWTYAASKIAAEHLVHAHHKEHGLPTVTIRPFNIYGERQIWKGAMHNFVTSALEDKDLRVNGDGRQVRSWCHVDDITDAVLSSLTEERAVGETFNIGNPAATITTFGLAEKIIHLAGSKSEIRFASGDFAEVERRKPSIDKAKELLGYDPKVGLDDGLARTIKWYRDNPGS